ADPSQIVLTARSGRHALVHRLQLIGVDLPKAALPAVWERFLEVADGSKQVEDETLIRIVGEVGGVQTGMAP
ncbi:MAG: hypothetical protein ACP5PW_00740, partial [Candidatus Dormibacteria bacterium]